MDEKSGPIEKKRETLDLRGVICPMTLVKTKVALAGLAPGDRLEVLIDHAPALKDMPEALRYEGHELLQVTELPQGVYRLVIQKKNA